MHVYKIYTNTGDNVASGSLLSDKVITKIPITVGGHVFALDWLIPGTYCAENRECFLHFAEKETIHLNVTLVYLKLMRIPIFKAIFS